MKELRKPQIRFAGFTDDWEQRKLGDILSESRIYGSNGKNANKLTVRLWGKGVVAKDDLLQGSEATQYFIRKAGQFIYGKLDFLNQAFGIIPDKLDGYESTLDAPAFDIDTNVNGKFLLEYISRENFYLHYGNLANGSRKAKRVHTNVVLDMPFIAPSFEEQTAIGDFFKQLDETIALHQREYEKYKNLKISYLEKMFPKENEQFPELRFPEFTDAWEQRKLLDNIISIIDFRGRTPKKLGLDWSESGYLALSALNVKNGYIDPKIDAHFGNEELYQKWMGDKKLRKGQVLFTTEAPMGNVAQVPDNNGYILSQRTIAFEINKKLITDDFLAIILRSPNLSQQLTALSSGGTAKGVSQKSLENVEAKFPTSLAEQTAIGNFFKQLDETIALHQRQTEKYQKLKTGFLESIFCTNSPPNNSKKTNAWEQRKLGEITISFSGGTPIVGNKEYYNGKIPFIRSGEINSDKTELFISQSGLENSSAKLIKKGDILYALYGATSGEVGRSKIDGAINQAILAIIPDEKNDPEFIAQWLRKHKSSIIQTYLQGGQGNLSGEIVKNLMIIKPKSSEEQTAIGDFFKQLDETIALHQRQIEKYRLIKKLFLEKMFIK